MNVKQPLAIVFAMLLGAIEALLGTKSCLRGIAPDQLTLSATDFDPTFAVTTMAGSAGARASVVVIRQISRRIGAPGAELDSQMQLRSWMRPLSIENLSRHGETAACVALSLRARHRSVLVGRLA